MILTVLLWLGVGLFVAAAIIFAWIKAMPWMLKNMMQGAKNAIKEIDIDEELDKK